MAKHHTKRAVSPDMSRLEEGDRWKGRNGYDRNGDRKVVTLRDEMWNLLLLVTLYMMQGVPLGITMGSMPFLLQSTASYTQIGIFTVASYPYSFKLLWSPIVDSVYVKSFGRRKSWIVPVQCASALLMISAAGWLEARLAAADIVGITLLFFFAVLLAATQDIAVDGWALTLLSKKHLGWASTCQTVGMNIGYFLSFTVFLALNDPSFCNKYIRTEPLEQGILTLSAYIRFWGWAFLLVTLIIALFKSESRVTTNGDRSGHDKTPELSEAYSSLWRVMKLPAVQRLALFLLACRIGMLPAEQASPLKLLEKGVSREALAGLVLLEFPCELLSAFLAGRWASSAIPAKPWIIGYRIRLMCAALVTLLVSVFPSNATSLMGHPQHFLVLALLGLITSFTSTLMFTALGNFFTRISDPDMGGAYLTLLNTISNMGVTVPKLLLFWLMDVLTVRQCKDADGNAMSEYTCPSSRHEAQGPNQCTNASGKCVVTEDGFYLLSYGMIVLGYLLSIYFAREFPKLEALPTESWRAQSQKKRQQ